jgi:hypothetical protein
MPKQRCQDMLVDLLDDAIDAGAANRNLDPWRIGAFADRCLRSSTAGLGRRKRRVVKRRAPRRGRR